jgi:hypothetical protein
MTKDGLAAMARCYPLDEAMVFSEVASQQAVRLVAGAAGIGLTDRPRGRAKHFLN